MKPRIAITVGDPAGIGPEIASKAAEDPGVLVAADEEGGDVTRLEARAGSSFPGNHALGAVDDPELTAAVAAALGRRLAACGVTLNCEHSAPICATRTRTWMRPSPGSADWSMGSGRSARRSSISASPAGSATSTAARSSTGTG